MYYRIFRKKQMFKSEIFVCVMNLLWLFCSNKKLVIYIRNKALWYTNLITKFKLVTK